MQWEIDYLTRDNSKCFTKFKKKKRVTPSSITLKNLHDYFKNMTDVEDNESDEDIDVDSDMDLNKVVFEELDNHITVVEIESCIKS